MAETTSTHEAVRQSELWRCTACGEEWDSIERETSGAARCPECRGPLRLVAIPASQPDSSADRTLVALSEDHHWMVVYWSDFRLPWTVLERMAEIDGYGATGDSYADSGQNARDVLSAFLAARRGPGVRPLEYAAAD